MDYHVWYVVEVLSSYWKGIVNTVWQWDKKRKREEGERKREKKEAGSSILLLSQPFFPSLFYFSPSFLWCLFCPLAVSVNQWLSYTHIQLNNITLLYLLSFCDPLCVCVTDWFKRKPEVLWKALKLLVFTMWWQRSVLFEMIYSRQWQIFGDRSFY